MGFFFCSLPLFLIFSRFNYLYVKSSLPVLNVLNFVPNFSLHPFLHFCVFNIKCYSCPPFVLLEACSVVYILSWVEVFILFLISQFCFLLSEFFSFWWTLFFHIFQVTYIFKSFSLFLEKKKPCPYFSVACFIWI